MSANSEEYAIANKNTPMPLQIKTSLQNLPKTVNNKGDINANTELNSVRQSTLLEAKPDEALNLIWEELNTAISSLNTRLNKFQDQNEEFQDSEKDFNNCTTNLEQAIQILKSPSTPRNTSFLRPSASYNNIDGVFTAHATITLPKIGTGSMEDINTAGVDLDDENFGRSSSITADLDKAVFQCERNSVKSPKVCFFFNLTPIKQI